MDKDGAPKKKRSLTAFMLFNQKYRAIVKAENPEATFGGVGKLVGELWNSLDESEKEVIKWTY